VSSRLTYIEEENNGRSRKRWFWTGFKLLAGIATVFSLFLLEQRLNEMGCRYAVNTVQVLGTVLFASGRELLKHRYTGYVLDTFYLLALGFILVSSVQGIESLESGGCTQYFEENTGVEIQPSTEFLNETEYREWQKNKPEEKFKPKQNITRYYK